MPESEGQAALTTSAADFLASVEGQPAQEISSSGQKRNAFTASDAIPYMRTGIGGDYEAIHTSIPAGAKITVGGIDTNAPSADLKALMTSGDIYPYWEKGKDVAERNADFTAKTLTDANQPAVAGSLKAQAAGLADADMARSMKMFTVPQEMPAQQPKTSIVPDENKEKRVQDRETGENKKAGQGEPNRNEHAPLLQGSLVGAAVQEGLKSCHE